jgi:hypothetical protein
MMGMPSDPRFPRAARRQLGQLFPRPPKRTALHKRRLRLSATIEALIAEFASHSPGFYDELPLVDYSTPVERASSTETAKRDGSSSLADALANASDYGSGQPSRFFWGFRALALFALDSTPRVRADLAQSRREARRDENARPMGRSMACPRRAC